jgi:hypothetical protein
MEHLLAHGEIVIELGDERYQSSAIETYKDLPAARVKSLAGNAWHLGMLGKMFFYISSRTIYLPVQGEDDDEDQDSSGRGPGPSRESQPPPPRFPLCAGSQEARPLCRRGCTLQDFLSMGSVIV